MFTFFVFSIKVYEKSLLVFEDYKNSCGVDMNKKTNSKKTFTLIELLIVVAIIGILMSMLLPSLSKARRAAKTAVSINNLKQIYLGSIQYVNSNDGLFFVTTQNYHVRNNDNTTNWSRMVYEEINGGLLPLTNNESMALMQPGTAFYGMMYCPVLRETRSDVGQHPQGRSDYSMNKFFRDQYKRLSGLEGKYEPFMTPGTQIGSGLAGPNLNSSDYDPDNNGHPIYEYKKRQTLGAFISGSVRPFSIAKGAEIDTYVSTPSDFK